MQPLLISLKPCYADLVFDGLKTVELRRRIVSPANDRDVFVYVTSPIRELRGGFRVGQVWQGSPEEVWGMVSELVSLNKREFDAYFEGQTIAYALEIRDIWEFQNPLGLSNLRVCFESFVVPQSWRYVTPVEHGAFQKLGRRTEAVRDAGGAASEVPVVHAVGG